LSAVGHGELAIGGRLCKREIVGNIGRHSGDGKVAGNKFKADGWNNTFRKTFEIGALTSHGADPPLCRHILVTIQTLHGIGRQSKKGAGFVAFFKPSSSAQPVQPAKGESRGECFRTKKAPPANAPGVQEKLLGVSKSNSVDVVCEAQVQRIGPNAICGQYRIIIYRINQRINAKIDGERS